MFICRGNCPTCCAGTLGNKVANDFKYGLKCAEADLKKLKLLNAYIEILCEYSPLSSTETLATGQITLSHDTPAPSGTVKIYVNGVLIGQATASTTLTQLAIDLNTSINSTTSAPDYTSTRDTYTLTISGATGSGSLPNGYQITYVVTGNLTVDVVQNMAGGISLIEDGDQCLTEEQAQNMFEEISEICKSCFGTINYTYS